VKRIIGIVAMAALMAALAVVAIAPAFAATAKEDIVRNFTITSTTIDPQTKVATVKGKVTCASEVNRAFVAVELSQVVGRLHTVRGFGQERLSCDGKTSFTLRFSAEEGRFGPGEATLRGFAGACIGREFEGQCDFDRTGRMEVRLTPA
jgi:hypothetical protein